MHVLEIFFFQKSNNPQKQAHMLIGSLGAKGEETFLYLK